MLFLDSWVWLEYLFDGEASESAERVIQRAITEGGLIAPTVVAEVRYRVRTVDGKESADDAVRALTTADEIRSMPIVDEIAARAADLRYRYYERGTCELSYADAIHVATASAHGDCEALYTGDPDFASVDEVETVVLER
ncbi:type II toxin-antitoxin system VapC family toxin [Halovivax gelatinilyticus]|uniref:type II toxin-antitoxin system VapC family toxin n=1 Tax=Halovivax gelatinilyticus TaxID=2961597 RepID=UPI0020CA8207|nr:PIN domain-containing protein [Halovivax gelatinilyticus]